MRSFMKQIVNEMFLWIKRKARFFKRSHRSSQLHPVRISKSDMANCQEYYRSLIKRILHEMEEVRCMEPEAYKGQLLFENYVILSFNGDRMGKVFRKDGEIYRGIYRESCHAFKELWETGLLQVLASNGMIPKTEITGYYTEEYPIILKQEQVQIVASKLWKTQMIKDAAILISLIKAIAEEVGFTLHDGHMNNVTFHRGRPVFTDIGSFVKSTGQYTVCNKEILFSGCYRIVFQQLGDHILSRIQPYDEENNAIWLQPRYYDDLTREYYTALNRYMSYHRFRSSRLCRRILRRMFYSYDIKPEYIDLIFKSQSHENPENIVPEAIKADIDHVMRTLQKLELDFQSVVDTGGTMGLLGERLAEQYPVPATSLEYSDAASVNAYLFCKDKKINSNTLEFHYLYGCDDDSRKAVTADLAIALDITHNILSYQQYRLDSLLNSLMKLTRGYAVITYYPNRKTPEKYIPLGGENGHESMEEVKKCFQHFFELLYMEEMSPEERDKENQGYLMVGMVKK